MPEEVKALTDELHAVLVELRRVGERLDKIERDSAAIKKRTDTEHTRAWWHRGVSLLLILIVGALFLFATAQDRQRQENCDSMREAFDRYTVGLADFSSAGAERTPEEEEAFDRRVALFRAEMAAKLAECN